MIFKKIQKTIERFLNISGIQHKPFLLIIGELIYWRFFQKGGIQLYFDYGLHFRGKKTSDYITCHEFKSIADYVNSPVYYPILQDKYYFHQILSGKDFLIPKCRFLYENYSFYDLNTQIPLTEKEFLEKDLDGICKVFNGYGGKMIYLIKIINGTIRLNGNEMAMQDILNLLGKKKYLIQDRIQQHPDMDRLNSSCVNTLRILTLRVGKKITLFKSYLRIGINGNYVDNGISGNIMVGMDQESGKLSEYAFLAGFDIPTVTMDRHPQTQVYFKDFQVPFYKEAVDMAKSLHELFRPFFMIGWDIGITSEGPIVIEGNNMGTLYPFQIIYGGQKESFMKKVKAYEIENLKSMA